MSKSKKINEALRAELNNEIEKRSSVMWEAIKALPNTAFDHTNDQLEFVIDIGRQAAEIKTLRNALHLI